MSYREYANGKHQHNNGHRFTGELLDLTRPLGDGYYHEYLARKELAKLYEAIGGHDAYIAWWERTFEQDGHTANDFTWQQIMTLAANENLRLEHADDCHCNGVVTCEVCKSKALIHDDSVLPY